MAGHLWVICLLLEAIILSFSTDQRHKYSKIFTIYEILFLYMLRIRLEVRSESVINLSYATGFYCLLDILK